MADQIPFIDLHAQRRRLGTDLDAAMARVVDSCTFVMGPEVADLEAQLARRARSAHALTCASGTDALVLALMALGAGPGDAVFVPSFTFAATAEAVALVGATPVFVDVRADSYNLDPDALAEAVRGFDRGSGPRPVGIIAVDLFGQPAAYDRLLPVATEAGLWVVADAAQSFGGSVGERPVGSHGVITTTSFFPAKPLGCYGDGGALFTDRADLADLLVSLRLHGQGADRYSYDRIGICGRLDTLQAAVLLQKLRIFDEELVARDRVARRYTEALTELDAVSVPVLGEGLRSAWAQYTIEVDHREPFREELAGLGIPTAVYYPRPLHLQPAYQSYPRAAAGLPVTEAICERVVSLPMHPYLDAVTQDRVIESVVAVLRRRQDAL